MRAHAILVVVIGAAFAAAVAFEAPWANGPWYWSWPWRDLGIGRTLLCLLPGLALAAIALVRLETAAEASITRQQSRRWLILLSLSTFLLQLGSAMADPRGPGLLVEIILSPAATSYGTDALAIREPLSWLAAFHTLELHLHSATHPPGPVLFCWLWFRLLGAEAGALAVALCLAAIAAAGPMLAYRLGRLFTVARRPRLVAAALYALMPATLLFFPGFDPIYPLIAMLLVLSWRAALEGNIRAALGAGVLLFGGCFFAYNLLVLGAPMVLMLAERVLRCPQRRIALARATRASGAVLGTWAGLLLMLHLATGFDAVRSFARALETQGVIAEWLPRPYAYSIAFDLYDFFLASGMMTLPLLILRLRQGGGPGADAMTWIGVAAILVVDLSGLLRTETARVWMFLQPFCIVPAGLALAGFRRGDRLLVWVLQAVILVLLRAKMSFIEP